ncbi:MAG: hypothetical protein K8H88_27850 [Sandaracinaceae bacterium]|nr:hypothetical protein [Sandaracinaceae bacterium]
MRIEEVRARLEDLRRELTAGQATLDELDRRRTELRDTMLRITGAIQVLEELLAAPGEAPRREP